MSEPRSVRDHLPLPGLAFQVLLVLAAGDNVAPRGRVVVPAHLVMDRRLQLALI